MLTKWNPFGEITKLQDEMNKLFEGFSKKGPTEMAGFAWNPAVDVYEEKGNYVLKAELPGLTKDDVEVHVEGRTLTLKGERKQEKEVKEETYHQVERSYGRFLRTYTFPGAIDDSKISAKFKDGVLEVIAPKTEDGKRKPIAVSGQ